MNTRFPGLGRSLLPRIGWRAGKSLAGHPGNSTGNNPLCSCKSSPPQTCQAFIGLRSVWEWLNKLAKVFLTSNHWLVGSVGDIPHHIPPTCILLISPWYTHNPWHITPIFFCMTFFYLYTSYPYYFSRGEKSIYPILHYPAIHRPRGSSHTLARNTNHKSVSRIKILPW